MNPRTSWWCWLVLFSLLGCNNGRDVSLHLGDSVNVDTRAQDGDGQDLTGAADADGVSVDAQPVDAARCELADAQCLPQVCEAGDLRCEGLYVQVCTEQGTIWSTVHTCDPEEQFCEGGACVDYTCQPDESWCEGETYFSCSEDGMSLTETDCAASDLVCTPTGCQDTLCEPDSVTCFDDFTVQECSTDGQELSTEACPEEHYCADGECLPQICVPMSPFCEGSVATVCNAKGSGGMVGGEQCIPGEQVCLDGVCVDCAPDCAGKECGDDGCGGTCGDCGAEVCGEGACHPCWDGNDVPWDGCNAGEIAEWQVNSLSQPNQYRSSIASLSDGAFVIAWESFGQDGDLFGVFARVFDANGAPASEDIQVNAWTASDQWQCKAAGLGNGGCFVVWDSRDQDVTDDFGVYGRVIGSAGEYISVESSINETAEGGQVLPDVACTATSQCFVAWVAQGQNLTDDIYGRWFDEEASPLGGEFRLNSNEAGDQRYPILGAAPDGSIWAAWDGVGPGDDKGIFLRHIEFDGPSDEPEIPVNSYTQDTQITPDISVQSDGQFAVVWSSMDADGSGWGVFVRYFDSSGGYASTDTVVNETVVGQQLLPAISAMPDGRYFVVWMDNYNIKGRFVSPFADLAGEEFMINNYNYGIQSDPDAQVLQGGNVVVSWTSEDQDMAGYSIFSQILDSTGNKIVPVI